PALAKEVPEFRRLIEEELPRTFRLVGVAPKRVHVACGSPDSMSDPDCRCVIASVIWLDATYDLAWLTSELLEVLTQFAERQLQQRTRERVKPVGNTKGRGASGEPTSWREWKPWVGTGPRGLLPSPCRDCLDLRPGAHVGPGEVERRPNRAP